MSDAKPTPDIPPSSKQSRDPENTQRDNNRDPRRKFKTRRKQRPASVRVKFEGRERKIKSFIYDCAESRQSIDTYIKTTDEIALFAGSKYATSTYIRTALEGMKRPPMIETKPVPPLMTMEVIPLMS